MPTRRLDIAGPYDLRGTVRTSDVGRWIDGGWWWPVWGDDGPSTLAVVPHASGVDGEAWGPRADDLLDRLPAIVGAGTAPTPRFPGTPADPYLARARGVRLAATRDLYEPLVAAVLGQVVTTTEAGSSMRRLRRRYGARAPGPREGLWALPCPQVIAGLRYEDLHGLGVERRRASIVIEVARRWKRIAPLVDRSPAEARRSLEAIRGIGPWSSALAVGSAMGAADEIPVGDYHLPNTVAWALAGEDRSDDRRMLELLDPYRPVRRRVLIAIVQSGIRAPRYGPKTGIRTHL